MKLLIGILCLILGFLTGSILMGLDCHRNHEPTHWHTTDETSKEATGKEAHYTFDDLLDAIEWVESKGDPDAVGDNGKAIGSFQIWKIYVDDVNRILKLQGIERHFFYRARLSRSASREMAMIYLIYYSDKAEVGSWDAYLETAARIHNGGPKGYLKESTKPYWLLVKARMESVK